VRERGLSRHYWFRFESFYCGGRLRNHGFRKQSSENSLGSLLNGQLIRPRL